MSCFLTNSSLGKKLVMSLTGCFLVLFILFHMSMNLVAIISPEGYNTICAFLGANWYALAGTVVLAPGVLGQTGVERGEIVGGLCGVVKPAAVIAIDALASRSVARLGCTVQLCDTGIAPGSGVGNNRKELNRQLLGVPVIGLGVPTVVDARTLAAELTGSESAAEQVAPRGAQMMVTPREIDLIISRASRLVAMAVNAALQPEYSPLELITVAAG